MTLLIALVLLLLLTSGATAAAEGWRRPLGGGVVARAFDYDRGAPFVRGARRGIDVSASPGARVGAVCGGVVTWAGRVPGWRRGVTLRCRRGLVATELGLGAVAVTRGAHVTPGTTIGRLWSRGVLRVGARRGDDRLGWVDPAPLFAQDGGAAPPLVAPAPRRRFTPRALVPAPARRPATSDVPVLRPSGGWFGLPPLPLPIVLILLGHVLVVAGMGGVVVVRGRRRRRAVPELATVQR